MNSRRLIAWCLALLVALPVAWPLDSEGRDITLEPSISVSGRHDDNIDFTTDPTTSDYLTIVEPGVGYYYKTELTEVEFDGSVQVINYIDKTELNTTAQTCNFAGSTQLSRRFTVAADLGYVNDRLLDSELEQTGTLADQLPDQDNNQQTGRQERTFELETRERFNVGGGVGFEVSEISTVGLNYEYTVLNYDSNARIDRIEHTIETSYERSFNQERDTLSIRPSLRLREPDTGGLRRRAIAEEDVESQQVAPVERTEQSYLVNVGWSHKSTEIGTINITVGHRITNQEQTLFNNQTEETDDTGFVADLNYELVGERSDFTIGYERDNSFDANAVLSDVDRFYIEYEHRFTERFSTNIRLNYYLTNSKGDAVDDDEEGSYYDGDIAVTYAFTENFSMIIDGRYSDRHDEGIESNTDAVTGDVTTAPFERDYTRAQYGLTFEYKFPINL